MYLEPIDTKKKWSGRLSEKDKQSLANRYKTLEFYGNLFIDTYVYEALIKMYPEVKEYSKQSYENGYIVTKNKN